jgi:hypothetical protein
LIGGRINEAADLTIKLREIAVNGLPAMVVVSSDG